jgi:hypothetical protein
LLVFLVLNVLPALPVSGDETPSFQVSPVFDLRVRQEVLDGVYHFAPDPYRNWVRIRSRLGAEASTTGHDFKVLLTNEHRHFIGPGTPVFDWDEIILDQMWWRWSFSPESKLTLGRQNIIWDRGFLMLEGHQLDGSRSIYHNAARLQAPLWGGALDLSVIYNPKRDPIVLARDKDQPLTDADESAVAARWVKGRNTWSAVWKNEVDPDGVLPHLQVLTLGGRRQWEVGTSGEVLAEVAGQFQHEESDGYAFALQAHIADDLGGKWRGKAGYFHYSGASGDLKPFRTPWGKWPKWSELYIYTLIGESTPGRVHVAAWENISAPHAEVTRPLGEMFRLRLAAYWLLAPQTGWASRGAMTQTELKFDILPELDGHLLWEMLVPGDFHDGRGGLPPLTQTVHFLRWQFVVAL